MTSLNSSGTSHLSFHRFTFIYTLVASWDKCSRRSWLNLPSLRFGVNPTIFLRYRSFQTIVKGVARYIYRRVLKAGEKGISIPLLMEDLEYEGVDPGAARGAIKKLTQSGAIMEEDGKLYPCFFKSVKPMNASGKNGDLAKDKIMSLPYSSLKSILTLSMYILRHEPVS